MKIKGIKKLTALFLCLTLAATVLCGIPFGAVSAAAPNTAVSSVVTKGGRTYIEHNGEPYLMYGIQMRLDWQYNDKITDNTVDWDWIEENFEKAVADGFKSVAIPVYWSLVEVGNHGIRSTEYLEKMYEYIYKYDLTVQWLWFGTNVCGIGSGTMPWYIIGNDSQYSNVFLKDVTWSQGTDGKYTATATDTDSPYVNYSNETIMQKEQDALAYVMGYIAERDTEKRCVMIQLNNEIDQGGNYWLPKDENGNYLDDWWTDKEGHDKYCYVFGQRAELFEQLDALGDMVHSSDYNCVTRVNLSDASRPTWAQNDYTDLLAYDGIDIVGIDCYYTDLTDINNRLSTSAVGNFTHLAESSATYDMSTNTAKLFESGIGNIIYCHRTDRTNGGLYQPQTGSDGQYNRQYKEWVDRESTPAVRAWNKSINKAYDKLAAAVANNELAVFTENAESKSVGSTQFTLSDTATGDKLALALKVNATEYVLISVKSDCEVALSNASILSAEVGEYGSNGAWVKSANAEVENGSVAVKAGEAVLVKTTEADIAGDALTATEDTLSNGAVVYKANQNGGTVVLADSIKDFALSFKYRDVLKDVQNPNPLNVKLRGGKYTLAIHEWATAGSNVKSKTLRFLGNGSAVGGNGHFEVADDVWTEFKIVMAGRRAAIFKNGVLWQSLDLKAEDVAGALTLEFNGAYDTYIADVKLTSAEERDTYALVDADLQSNEVYGNNKFCNMPLTYANGNTKIDAGMWTSYKLYGNPGEYELSVDFHYDSIQNYRGLGIITPAGSDYLFIDNNLCLNNNGYAAVKSLNINLNGNSQYHKLKLVYADNIEYVYFDSNLLYQKSVTSSNGDLKLNFRLANTECVYLKNIKLVNTENISRTTVTELPELNESFDYSNYKSIFGYSWSNTQWEAFSKDGISGAKVTSSKGNQKAPMFTETDNPDKVFSFKLYMPAPEQESTGYATNAELYLRRLPNESDFGLKLVFQNKRVYVDYKSAADGSSKFKEASYSNTEYFAASPIGRWADVEIYMFGTSFMLAIDGEVIFCENNVKYDFTAPRESDLYTNIEVSQIAFADIKLEQLDGLRRAVTAINNVTFNDKGIADETLRQAAITAYGRLFSEAERYYLCEKTSWFEIYYDYCDVNIDGNVNILDLVRLKKITSNLADATVKSDINRDESHNGSDLTLLRKYLLGV